MLFILVLKEYKIQEDKGRCLHETSRDRYWD